MILIFWFKRASVNRVARNRPTQRVDDVAAFLTESDVRFLEDDKVSFLKTAWKFLGDFANMLPCFSHVLCACRIMLPTEAWALSWSEIFVWPFYNLLVPSKPP